MRTFVRKPNTNLQTASAESMMSGRAKIDQSREMNSILHLQRTIGNQAVQRLQAKKKEDEANSDTVTPSPLFSHDFSRIPLYVTGQSDIQPKLAANATGDRKNRVTEKVLRKEKPGAEDHEVTADYIPAMPEPSRFQRTRFDYGGAEFHVTPPVRNISPLFQRRNKSAIQKITTDSPPNILRRTVEVNGREWSEAQGEEILQIFNTAIRRRYRSIYREMVRSDDTFSFPNRYRLAIDLERRDRLIRQTARINSSNCCGYPRPSSRYSPQVNSAVRSLWQHVQGNDPFEFVLNAEGMEHADRAVEGLFTPQSEKANRTLLDCTHMTAVLHYYSTMMTMGRDRFRQQVREGRIVVNTAVIQNIESAPYTAARMYEEHIPGDERSLVPGDHVYFSNHYTYRDLIMEIRRRRRISGHGSCPAVTPRESRTCQDIWTGEHAVYLGMRDGRRMFQGHGTPPRSNDQMKGILLRHYNCHVAMARRCTPPITTINGFTLRTLSLNDIPGLRNPSIPSQMQFIRRPIMRREVQNP